MGASLDACAELSELIAPLPMQQKLSRLGSLQRNLGFALSDQQTTVRDMDESGGAAKWSGAYEYRSGLVNSLKESEAACSTIIAACDQMLDIDYARGAAHACQPLSPALALAAFTSRLSAGVPATETRSAGEILCDAPAVVEKAIAVISNRDLADYWRVADGFKECLPALREISDKASAILKTRPQGMKKQ